MRRLLQDIGDRLRGFVEQRDDVALILSSPAADSLPILSLVEGLEAASSSDLFWLFTDNFTEAGAYADAIVAAFATKHGAVRQALEKEGMRPWPPLPAAVLSSADPPAQRLRDLASFSRELLPIPNGGNIIWVFYPLEVDDWTGFAALMEQVLHHEFPNPWCHHLRFIIRADPADRAMPGALEGLPRTLWYQPDLGPEAIQRSLEEASMDEDLPLEERLGNLMVLAGSDHANRRYSEALEKYELVLQYHAPRGNLTMAALALNGMGEAYEKMGDADGASESYLAALAPASLGDHPPIPVLLNVVLNLANLRLVQERWAEGEACYDMAQQLATLARNGPAKIQALEYRGVCQRQQGQIVEAEQSWYQGSVLAAQLEDVELCRRSVERLRLLYADTGQTELERERSEQLESLGEPRAA